MHRSSSVPLIIISARILRDPELEMREKAETKDEEGKKEKKNDQPPSGVK